MSVRSQAMLEHAAPQGGVLNLEQLSKALSVAAKELQVTTSEDVEALNHILGQVPHPPCMLQPHFARPPASRLPAGHAGRALGIT